MIWSGSPFVERIEFSTGLPTGAVSYQLLGNDGAVLLEDDLVITSDTLSTLIVIQGTHNTCSNPFFENRTLVYSYVTAGGLVSNRVAYRVARPIPFIATTVGVRGKLGVEGHELPDDEIDLLAAYAEFVSLFTAGALTPYETTGDRTTLLCIHAIEAIAALIVLPALQLKVAQRESSGTNEYQRFSGTDWALIENGLAAHIARARTAIDPNFDATGGTVFSFGTATRADAFTGA